ncbi:MAG: hypothetical protein K9M44_00990 [Candidatus Pacebacteria bacterium]|nr:hypothetical protein [Candidatus Paceibacterota bacterium]
MKKSFLFIFTIAIIFLVSASIFLFKHNNVNRDNLVNSGFKNLSLQAVLAAMGDEIIFKWDEVIDDVSYYTLYHGVNSGVYGESIKTNGKVTSLALSTTNFNSYIHYFVLSAVDAYGNESNYSEELVINLDPDLAGTCGNGLWEQAELEVCDGGYQLCFSGAYKGVKSCLNDCYGWEIDCLPIESCGDGLVNGNEKCDPNAKVDSFIYCNEGNLLGKKYCNESCQYGACQINDQAL